mmetsp:Transcript_13880/g.17653  ORF Transcript_13880/g.17653 Transcript_13880/m.17653 type:complete len:328 (+) Transcript_13880:304-1287(+)
MSEIFNLLNLLGKKNWKREHVIAAILLHVKENPDLVKMTRGGRSLLHMACQQNAPFEVVSALLKAWPDGAKKIDPRGYTPLYAAIVFGAPIEVVSALIDAWPDGVKAKADASCTPLYIACTFDLPIEVVSALLNAWPDGAKEKNDNGDIPLQAALRPRPRLEIVSALLDAWPESVSEKNDAGNNNLYGACLSEASYEVIALLLDKWLGDKENRKPSGKLIIDRCASVSRASKIVHLFSFCSAIYTAPSSNNPSISETVTFFASIEHFIDMDVWNGVAFVLDKHPNVVKMMNVDTNAMALLLSKVGRCCRLTTMWKLICNEQDLLEGV